MATEIYDLLVTNIQNKIYIPYINVDDGTKIRKTCITGLPGVLGKVFITCTSLYVLANIEKRSCTFIKVGLQYSINSSFTSWQIVTPTNGFDRGNIIQKYNHITQILKQFNYIYWIFWSQDDFWWLYFCYFHGYCFPLYIYMYNHIIEQWNTVIIHTNEIKKFCSKDLLKKLISTKIRSLPIQSIPKCCDFSW